MEVSEFVIGKLIGEGDFSKVFLCKRKESKEKFAMKVLKRENFEMISYECETKNISKVNHENIIKWIKSEQIGENFCIVTEYFPGKTLLYVIESLNRPFRRNEIFPIFIPLMRALCYLHNLNIMHGDVDVVNIMIKFGKSKNVEAVKLIDFGRSDPYFVPPSSYNFTKNNCCQVDIYDAGLVLLKMLHGTNNTHLLSWIIESLAITRIRDNPVMELCQNFVLIDVNPFFRKLVVGMIPTENGITLTSIDVLRLLQLNLHLNQ